MYNQIYKLGYSSWRFILYSSVSSLSFICRIPGEFTYGSPCPSLVILYTTSYWSRTSTFRYIRCLSINLESNMMVCDILSSRLHLVAKSYHMTLLVCLSTSLTLILEYSFIWGIITLLVAIVNVRRRS